jgi:hypothetical protein
VGNADFGDEGEEDLREEDLGEDEGIVVSIVFTDDGVTVAELVVSCVVVEVVVEV